MNQYTVTYSTGYEVGRFDQLNEDAENRKNECFNLSKNTEVNDLLKTYFKDCKTAHIMYAIAHAESGGKNFKQHLNHNFSVDGGFLQVNSIHKNKDETVKAFVERMHLLSENVKLASEVYKHEGFTAWVTYKNGQYLKFLINN